jgi:histidinol-phosphate/aromatic aminotransferase/cobyric acid decarboxylase-like protein
MFWPWGCLYVGMPYTSELEWTDQVERNCMAFPESKAFHGGKSFEAIGVDFRHLERAEEVISADVLDAWFDPSPRVIEKLLAFLPFLARTSPPVRAAGLVEAIASQRGIPEDCILTGGGSSDLIFACLPHLLPANGQAMILDPMYGEYQYLFDTVMGVKVTRFSLDRENDFRVETDAIVAEVWARRPDLIVLVNPNSPTGQHWPRAQFLRFLDSIPESARVVVDETYIDYVGAQESVEREAAQRSNLLVIKSMSKVYALSGLRAGYLVADPCTIRRLGLWIPPWSVSLPAQLAAVEALRDPNYYAERYRQTSVLREELISNLRQNNRLRVYGSAASFVLVETASSAQQIIEAMRPSNIFVRNCDSMSKQFADRFLRVAVKTHSQNQRIAEALAAATERFR